MNQISYGTFGLQPTRSHCSWHELGPAVALIAALAIVAVVAAGCAHSTAASRPDDECGAFSAESRDIVLPAWHSAGSEYATYSGACAGRLFAQAVAQRRAAWMAGAQAIHAREQGARDPVAREQIATTQQHLLCVRGNIEECRRACAAGIRDACDQLNNSGGMSQ